MNIAALFRNQNAFTLIELLIALFIFSILSVMAYSGLNTVLNNSQFTQEKADELKNIQLAFTIIQRDFIQVVNRQVRDPFGGQKNQLALQSGNGFDSIIDLTRSGWNNPAQQLRGHLQRVSYQLTDNELYRSYWVLLDNTPEAEPIKTVLLKDVERVEFRYLDQKNTWHKTWPPLQLENYTILPIAVELTLEHAVYSEIKRLFAITD